MLRRLVIKNIALIESETIDFSSGFTVFSGETGAGKSLIIDSLNLVLGSRADKSLITYGKDYAEVEASFDSLSNFAKETLFGFGVDDNDEIIVYRRIWQDGRSDIRVNGHSFTLKMLKTVTSLLVDICGQFENQTMFSTSNQLALIDSIAGNGDLLSELNSVFDNIGVIDDKLEELGGNETERERTLDMLSFQISEIEDAAFFDGEEEQLQTEHRKIVAREKIIDSISSALKYLDTDEEDNVADKLKAAAIDLSVASQSDENFVDIENKLSAVSYDVKDCIFRLEELAEEYSSSDFDIDKIEQRLDLLNKFKKKYGQTILDINNFFEEAKERYNLLIDSSENIKKLEIEKEKLLTKAKAISEDLSKRRKQAAALFARDIESELLGLGMKSARFCVSIENKELNTRNGFDSVEFMFSANSGMPVKSLAKVASGGELSRFMLSLKTVLGKHSEISTMVFDEIDTGISGVIGRIVGEKLFAISKECQVVCVTHLAQIAAIADNNFLIEKSEENGKTKTKVSLLNTESKIKEIARLAGGDEEADVAIAHSAELIAKADTFKKNLNK